jgi:hypothetical protein
MIITHVNKAGDVLAFPVNNISPETFEVGYILVVEVPLGGFTAGHAHVEMYELNDFIEKFDEVEDDTKYSAMRDSVMVENIIKFWQKKNDRENANSTPNKTI